jgi:hypothetical protein
MRDLAAFLAREADQPGSQLRRGCGPALPRRTSAFDPRIAIAVIEFKRKERMDRKDAGLRGVRPTEKRPKL